MAEAGVSNKGLAARVREFAERDGHVISPDHVSVRRWLDGVNPRGGTQHYIAVALGAKLGRRVTLEEVGFSDSAGSGREELAARGIRYPADPQDSVSLLASLAEVDLEDEPSVAQAGWVPDATPGVITSFLFGRSLGVGDQSELPERASAAGSIRSTAAHLMDLDFKVGGGSTRRLLLFYFRSEVVPLLRRHLPAPVRRDLFSAAAEVAQLLGWTAYDAGRHGAAQRYFVQGLRLAHEADDHLLGGRLLANLSHQANYLGQFDDAVQLARAAQTVALRRSAATVSAMFLAMEARALASSGQARACIQVLHEAEQVFERRDPSRDPSWIAYFNPEELAGEAAHCFRELGRSKETRLFAAQALGPSANTPLRTRAFIGMVNAAGALTGGNLDEAVALATEAVDLAGSLQSRRYVRYLADFHGSLVSAHAGHPLVVSFTEKAGQYHPMSVSART